MRQDAGPQLCCHRIKGLREGLLRQSAQIFREECDCVRIPPKQLSPAVSANPADLQDQVARKFALDRQISGVSVTQLEEGIESLLREGLERSARNKRHRLDREQQGDAGGPVDADTEGRNDII